MAIGEELWYKEALFTAEIYDLIRELEPELPKYGFETKQSKTKSKKQNSQNKVFLKIKIQKIEKSN